MPEIAQAQLRKFTDEIWRDEIVPALTEYIRIPNKSPSFDPEWEKHGYMEEALQLLVKWGDEDIRQSILDALRPSWKEMNSQ